MKVDEEIKIVEESRDISTEVTEEVQSHSEVALMEDLTNSKISELHESNSFTDVVDKAKISIVSDATENDAKFVGEVKDTLKKATLKRAKVEEKKASLEGQNIDYHAELLSTQQELNEYKQAENKWTNRERRRQYHYNGVKPIMQFVGIVDPMNLMLLYFLTLVLTPFYLLSKLLRGTVGVLVAGASDKERSSQVRGLLWTLLAVICVGVVALLVYLTLSWIGVI